MRNRRRRGWEGSEGGRDGKGRERGERGRGVRVPYQSLSHHYLSHYPHHLHYHHYYHLHMPLPHDLPSPHNSTITSKTRICNIIITTNITIHFIILRHQLNIISSLSSLLTSPPQQSHQRHNQSFFITITIMWVKCFHHHHQHHNHQHYQHLNISTITFWTPSLHIPMLY